jgi:predicted ribosomally synthesized peptide with SipW-like signal peptide
MGAMNDYDKSAEDPCRAEVTASSERALAFVLLFVIMFGGGTLAFFSDSSYVTVSGVVLAYTASVMIYGFARNRGNNPPYLFTCPVVMSQYSCLLKRHAGFLGLLITFVTIAARFVPHPDGWASRSSETPLLFIVIPIGVLAITEIMTNRGVLERAHRDRFGEPSAANDSDKDGTLSIFRRDQ